MKSKYSLVGSSLLLSASMLIVGCGGGGSGGGSGGSSGGGSGGGSGGSSGGGGTISSATTSVSGTTGSGSGTKKTSSLGILKATIAVPTASTDSRATLVVDKDGNGLLDDTDLVYSTFIMTDGHFSFDSVAVDKTKPTLAQLTLSKEGYAPVVKTLSLTKDNPLSIYADITAKPVLTNVVDISKLSQADRANTFVRFGVSRENGTLSSFSKMMTLSELKAEEKNGVALGYGTLSQTTMPLAAINKDVKSITANMQSFDSTKPGDLAVFPGKFSGHGYPVTPSTIGGTQATGGTEEVALESAAFDLVDFRDQNGNPIDLNTSATPASKLGATADAASCPGLYWQRHVTDAQASVIEDWGDDDNSTTGFQTPIWSNDNSTGSWQFVGEADWNSNSSSFSICVDQKWEGYLNCDSPINVGTAPKELCIYVADQHGNVMHGGLDFRAQKGNSISNDYLGYDGKAVVDLATGTPSDWNVSYSGPITGGSNVGINTSGYKASSTAGCDYDLNVTVDNPYSAKVYVYPEDENNESLSNVYVQLENSSHSDYYDKGAYTNTKGYAVFDVKPNVSYTASYKAGTSLVNVDDSIRFPETADSGKYASVVVWDENVAPQGYIYTYRRNLTTNVESLEFYISASDANNDPLTLENIKLNGTALRSGSDYTVEDNYSYNGYLYVLAKLDLNSSTVSAIQPESLKSGNYTLTATISDGKLSSTPSTSFSVSVNHPPVVNSIYLSDSNYNYYYENSTIPEGTYSIGAYAYDIDGDTVTTTISLDGTTVSGDVTLSSGDHNISVTANDGSLRTTKTVQIYVGNHAPVITNAGATKYRVDINAHETFKLYAYAEDQDYGDSVTVTAKDANGTVYPMHKAFTYGTKYISNPITLTTVSVKNDFTIIANDGETNSTAATVSVESYAANQPPHFTKELTDTQVNVNTQTTFECSAEDPEGTFVTYSWSLDGQALSETTGSYTTTFTTTGAKHLSCTATDEDGKSATSSAAIVVVDPTQNGTLTIHTDLPNMKASINDPKTLKAISEKTTDANGDVTFSVTGDRVTFALTKWSGMVIDQNVLMKLVKREFLSNAKNACDQNSSVASECSSADWCAMVNADTIDDWAWDVAASYDKDDNDTTPSAKVVDADSDGKISASELYSAALQDTSLNKNGDDKITYDEFNGDKKSISTNVFVNVPVREYYISVSGEEYYKYDNEIFYECRNKSSFDTNLTLHTDEANNTIYGSVSGSAYADFYGKQTDQNGNVNLPLTVYNPANDGNYDLLVKGRTDADQEDYFYFLQDKTKADLQNGITLNTSDFQPADKNVTMKTHNSSNNYSGMWIDARYKGLWLDNESDGENYIDSNTSVLQLYANKNFTYNLSGWESSSSGNSWRNKGFSNYYGDGTLKDSYDIADYPMLDANIAFNKHGQWTLSGKDLSKVNSVDYSLDSYAYDQNSSSEYDLHIDLTWTVAPTQSPDVNITAVIPSDLQDTVKEIIGKTNSGSDKVVNVNAEEFKGLSESQFIDVVAGSASAAEKGNSDDFDFDSDYGDRYSSAGYNPLNTVAGAFSANMKKSMKKHRIKKPFTIKLNVSKLFSK